ncbi:MAG: hypothetical protein H0T89_22605 [Deltaproteobacteria bacterium]|nr:hypothetical protein [Deltaproteobacteria bacterium]MDQ3299277.1 hypothetical protein [Myxococcota bacterium]
MGSKILTKTDQMMEDRMIAVSDDPVRADTLAKARAFKRTWLELAEALSRCTEKRLFVNWGYTDFESYCRKELHLRGSTVAKLLGSYRFLETSAPRVIERARTTESTDFVPPIPSMQTVEFVQKATEKGAADEETLRTIHRSAFEEGLEAPVLAKKFGELAFPQTNAERKEKLRAQIAAAARRLSALIAEDGSPVPRQLAIRVEETVGELLESIEN